jgi:hypothetical protein
VGGELPAPNATFLGLGRLPREVTAVQVEVFFQFSADEPGLSKSAVGRTQVETCVADRLSAPERQALRCGADGAAARRQHESQLMRRIDQEVEPGLLMQWRTALTHRAARLVIESAALAVGTAGRAGDTRESPLSNCWSRQHYEDQVNQSQGARRSALHSDTFAP